MWKSLLLFLLILALSVSLVKDSVVARPIGDGVETQRLVIKYRPLIPDYFKDRLAKQHGFSVAENLKLKNTQVIKVPTAQADKIRINLERNFIVEYAEPDFVATALEEPNDTYFPDQWGLAKIKAPEAWEVAHGSVSTEIAVLDTGIDGRHSDIGSKIIASVDCTKNATCPSRSARDRNGHGTHVAGIAGALTNNARGVASIGYETGLASVKVLNDRGSGYYSWIINGIIWASDNHARVINLSLGGSSYSKALEDAINYAWDKGVIVVAAAGNSGGNTPVYPAFYTNTIAVAATDSNDNKASFSNYGSWVDVSAPGASILSTYNRGRYAYMSGTSMATPFVSGLAGLLISYHSDWNNSQIRNKIESTADNIAGTGLYWVYGRINACDALDCNEQLLPTSTPAPTITQTPVPTATPPLPTSTPTPQPTATPAPTAAPTSIPTPTVTPTPTETPSSTPAPTSKPLPWWCRYIPWHRTCQ